MVATLVYRLFAQAYGAGSYNSAAYGGSSTAAGGGLTNTGIAIISIVTIAALLLLVAIVVRIWRRPSKRVVPDEANSNQD